MKRILILWTAFMLMLQLSAQTTQESIIRVDSLNQKFGKTLAAGQLVRLKNSMVIYQLRKATTVNNTLTQVLADPTWYYSNMDSPSFTGNVSSSAAGSFFNSGRTFFDSTLYLGDDNQHTWIEWVSQQMGTGGTKSRVVMKNMGDYYIQAKSGVGDVIVIQRDTTGGTATANLSNINALTMGGIFTAGSVTRGNASFSGALTRLAVYLPGVTAATDYVFVSPNAVDAFTRPVAGDFTIVKIVNDSLIFLRQDGTTANLSIDWFRIK
jgi:hypothetical protein